MSKSLTEIPLGYPCIDSLKLRIKLSKVSNVHPLLTEQYVKLTVLPDGHAIPHEELHNPDPYIAIVNGVKFRIYCKFYIRTLPNKTKVSERYLVLGLSSKMVGSQYFQGITAENIELIHQKLMDLNLFTFSKKALLDGLVSDVDICTTNLIEQETYKTCLKFLYSSCKLGKRPLIRPPADFNDIGLQFNNRPNANNSTPFAKVYHKGIELQHPKSIEFYKTFLAPIDSDILKDLVRFEGTIKNYKHKKYLENKIGLPPFKTLSDLLQTKKIHLHNFLNSISPLYVERVKPVKIDSSKTPAEIVLMGLVSKLIKHGETLTTILEVLDPITVGSSKTKQKQKITAAYNEIKGQSKEVQALLDRNEEIQKFNQLLNLS